MDQDDNGLSAEFSKSTSRHILQTHQQFMKLLEECGWPPICACEVLLNKSKPKFLQPDEWVFGPNTASVLSSLLRWKERNAKIKYVAPTADDVDLFGDEAEGQWSASRMPASLFGDINIYMGGAEKLSGTDREAWLFDAIAKNPSDFDLMVFDRRELQNYLADWAGESGQWA
jgi:hypothetical protein